MAGFTVIFSPIVWLMERVFSALFALTDSAGIAILLLSTAFSLLLAPLQRWGLRAEARVAARTRLANAEVRAKRTEGLRGEALFHATEAIYQRHGYHPIQAVMGAASLVVMLPVLISSIILCTGTDIVAGRSFLFIDDLGRPDATLALAGVAINVLPLVMVAITLTDARLRFRGDAPAQRRVLIVSVVLAVLVYAMPAGLVLYWIGNNLVAAALARVFTLGAGAPSA